jgi:GxxExxY protein
MDLIYRDEAYSVIGACMDVHGELGMGFLEAVYHEALEIELASRKISFEHEVPLAVIFKGKPLRKKYYADFVCHKKIIVEIKAVKTLLSEHESQLFNYLKATGYKLGLLVNFGEKSLVYKRIVCSEYFDR